MNERGDGQLLSPRARSSCSRDMRGRITRESCVEAVAKVSCERQANVDTSGHPCRRGYSWKAEDGERPSMHVSVPPQRAVSLLSSC
jgi:hypothetical protein